MPSEEPLLPPHGGYRDLKAFQNAEIIHDGTVAFCRRFFKATDRTVDQMVQAARSGKQNIAEGSSMSGTSRGSELRLIGVARASFEELLVDYEDFLRQRSLLTWPKGHEKAEFIRRLAYRPDKCYATYRVYVEEKTPESAANTMICLVRQNCFLLDKLKQQLSERLLQEGGISEKIYRERKARREY